MLQYTYTASDSKISQHYPFGIAIPSQSFALPNENDTYQNRYLYNGKEYQDDFGLNWYDYRARFYDPQLARWHSVDKKAEILPHLTPYRYGFNNPLRFIDPDGNIEEERIRAVNRAREYVTANSNRNSSLYGYSGWRNQVPGYKVDCSGLVDDAARYSSVGHLNITATQYYRGRETGVKNIIHQERVREITDANQIRHGDIFSINNDKHTGFVADIVRNEKGIVIGFTIIHSRGSTGPIEEYIDLTITNRKDGAYAWDFFINKAKYYAWDTLDDDEPGLIGPKRLKTHRLNTSKTSEDVIRDIFMRTLRQLDYEFELMNRGAHPSQNRSN